jgi:hypothetical protein
MAGSCRPARCRVRAVDLRRDRRVAAIETDARRAAGPSRSEVPPGSGEARPLVRRAVRFKVLVVAGGSRGCQSKVPFLYSCDHLKSTMLDRPL